jgi:hypothetical protein
MGQGWPNALNTGPRPGAALTLIGPGGLTSGPGWTYVSTGNGFIQVTADNTTLSRYYIPCNLDIENVSGVKVLDCVIVNSSGGAGGGVKLKTAPGLEVGYCSISSAFSTGPNRLLVGVRDNSNSGAFTPWWWVHHCNIFNCSTGIQGESGLWEYNYIHDLGFDTGDHLNGTTSNGAGTTRYFLHQRNNTVLNQTTNGDAISLFEDSGVQANRVIENNLVAGGSYSIYCGQNSGSGLPTYNIVARNNRVSTITAASGGVNGPAAALYKAEPTCVWSGNVWHETGASIPVSAVAGGVP